MCLTCNYSSSSLLEAGFAEYYLWKILNWGCGVSVEHCMSCQTHDMEIEIRPVELQAGQFSFDVGQVQEANPPGNSAKAHGK